MSNGFRMNPGALHTQGGRISELASDFGANAKELMDIVTLIHNVGYKSEASEEIYNEAKGKEPVLAQIQAKLDAHGEFGRYASNETVANQEAIAASIVKPGVGGNNLNFTNIREIK